LNGLFLGGFSAFETPEAVYLFFYTASDERKSGNVQSQIPNNLPKWNKGKGPQYVVTQGDAEDYETIDPLNGLVELYAAHKPELQENYRIYKKRAEKLRKEKQNKQPETKPTESTIYYWKEQ